MSWQPSPQNPGSQPNSGPYPAQQPGYPPQQPGYPGPQPGYPGQPGYPPQPGYAPQPGYPGQQPGYPQQGPGPQPGYQAASYGAYPPQAGPQMGSAPARKSRMTRVVIIVVAVILVLVLGVFLSIRVLMNQGSAAKHTFEPAGALSNVWLLEGYADGYTSWSTTGTVVGTSPDSQVVLVSDSQEGRVYGADLTTGAAIWQLEGLSCNSGAALEGTAFCLEHTASGENVHQIDVATGAATLIYSAPFRIYQMTALGSYNGLQIVQGYANGVETILAFAAGGSIAWQVAYEAGLVRCQLLGDHVGCHSEVDDNYAVIAAADGSIVQDITALDTLNEEMMIWLADGYMFQQGWFDNEIRPIYDFAGNEIGQALPWSGPAFPTHYEKVFYPSSDVLAGGTVSSIDASGKVVTEYGGGGQVFRPSGKSFAGSDSVIGASASGAVVAVSTTDGLNIHNRNGDVLHTIPADWMSVYLVQGVLTETQSGGGDTVVYAPLG